MAFFAPGKSPQNIFAAASVAPGPISHALVSVVCVNASSMIVIAMYPI
jgi:hypothetical protein